MRVQLVPKLPVNNPTPNTLTKVSLLHVKKVKLSLCLITLRKMGEWECSSTILGLGSRCR
jgi:hypothetical protein